MRMNKLAAVLCAAVMMGTSVPAAVMPLTVCAAEATSGTCGTDVKWEFDTASGTLTISGTGDMEDYEQGAAPWDALRNDIKKIIVQDGVTSIGAFAFDGCYNATEVSLPDTLKKIGIYAFGNSNKLTRVKLPASVTEMAEQYEDKAHIYNPFGRSTLTAVEVDAENPAFVSVDGVVYTKDMKTLVCYPSGKEDESYTVPDSVTAIAENALSNNYLKNLTLPDGLVSIDLCGISSINQIESIRIPASVTNIMHENFTGCESLPAIEVAEGNTAYTSVDGVLFTKDMTVLKAYPAGKAAESYEIPASVTTIDFNAFNSAKPVTVTVPDNVTAIKGGAFQNCQNLKDIIILNPDCEIRDDPYTISNGWSEEQKTTGFFGTIHGYDDSAAQQYAKNFGYHFESLGSAPVTTPAAIMGDIDGSGSVDIMDVIKVNKATLGVEKLTDEQQELADINKDGKVDSADALLLLKIALGMPIE